MAGTTLFNIVGEMQELYLMLTECADDEETEKVIQDTLEAVKGELEVKAEGYIHVIQQIEMEQKRCEELEYEWHLKAIKRKESIARLKAALKDALIATGHDDKDGLKTGDYTLKVVANGGVTPIVYDHEEDIPQSLMKVEYKKDAKLIRQYLEEHPETKWAHIEPRGTHLAIK